MEITFFEPNRPKKEVYVRFSAVFLLVSIGPTPFGLNSSALCPDPGILRRREQVPARFSPYLRVNVGTHLLSTLSEARPSRPCVLKGAHVVPPYIESTMQS